MVVKKYLLFMRYTALALVCFYYPVLRAAHFVYLKNSLKESTFKHPTTGNTITAGPAFVSNASLKKVADDVASYDDYPSIVKPNTITWAASTPAKHDECSDTAACQIWKLTFDVGPVNSQEAGIDASTMQPIYLAPADDIEIVYTQPTADDPGVYYGYIVYEGGDRFESVNDTNSGIPSPVKPVVKSDGITKFPVHPQQKPVIVPNPPDKQAPLAISTTVSNTINTKV
jgi:hypothetical protein